MTSSTPNHLTIAFCGVLFAIFIAFFPWEVVRGDEFADLVNYTTRIYLLRDFGKNYFVWDDTILGWLKFEYLWFNMLVYASNLNVEPVVFIKTITLISAFLTYWFLSSYLGVVWSFVVLTNPITVDLLSSQIRSGFAFSIFLLAVSLKTGTKIDWLKYPLLLTLPFIHSGMHLLLLIYASCWAMSYVTQFRPATQAYITVIVAIITAFFIARYLPTVAEIAEDRRATIQYSTKSIAYLAFWLICGVALTISYSWKSCRSWEYFFGISICVMGPIVEAMGTPGFRFVALAIPVIFAGLTHLQGTIRDGTIIAAPLYSALLFYYWVQ